MHLNSVGRYFSNSVDCYSKVQCFSITEDTAMLLVVGFFCTWQHFIDVLFLLFLFSSGCPSSVLHHLLATRWWCWGWGSCRDLSRRWWQSCCPFYIIICLLFIILFLFLIIIKWDEAGAQVYIYENRPNETYKTLTETLENNSYYEDYF